MSATRSAVSQILGVHISESRGTIFNSTGAVTIVGGCYQFDVSLNASGGAATTIRGNDLTSVWVRLRGPTATSVFAGFMCLTEGAAIATGALGPGTFSSPYARASVVNQAASTATDIVAGQPLTIVAGTGRLVADDVPAAGAKVYGILLETHTGTDTGTANQSLRCAFDGIYGFGAIPG